MTFSLLKRAVVSPLLVKTGERRRGEGATCSSPFSPFFFFFVSRPSPARSPRDQDQEEQQSSSLQTRLLERGGFCCCAGVVYGDRWGRETTQHDW